MLLNWARTIVGKIILALDSTFSPKPMERSSEDQARAEAAVSGLVMYQFEACPFCVKVRRELKRLNLVLELRDATVPEIADELIQGGGELQVPCLRIPEKEGQVRWLYESDEIIAFLRQKVA